MKTCTLDCQGRARFFAFWNACNAVLCLLPAVILFCNQKILSVLSLYLSSGSGDYSDVLPYIVLYGSLLTLSGLSARINTDFLYFHMYDSYYLGMQGVMMDFMQKMPMEFLFR